MTLDTFTDERLNSADMQALLRKITIDMPPEMPSLYNTGRYGDVIVTMRDGRTVRARCTSPRGSWGAPPISPAEHQVKVRTCLATYLSPDKIEEVIGLAARLETLDGAGVRRLLHLASSRATTH